MEIKDAMQATTKETTIFLTGNLEEDLKRLAKAYGLDVEYDHGEGWMFSYPSAG
jgi:hypothetical protein